MRKEGGQLPEGEAQALALRLAGGLGLGGSGGRRREAFTLGKNVTFPKKDSVICSGRLSSFWEVPAQPSERELGSPIHRPQAHVSEEHRYRHGVQVCPSVTDSTTK